MGLLDIYDEEGNVIDQLKEDTDDGDELDSVLNKKEGEGEGEGESGDSSEQETETPNEGGDDSSAKEGEEEKAGEADEGTPEGDKEVPAGEEEEEPEDEAQALRRLTKRQERQIAFLEARLQRLEKSVIQEPAEGEEEEPPSKIEQLQATINQISQEKGPSLEMLVEAMAQTPKYADIKEVCSQDNFNDLVSMAADRIASTENRDPVEVALELEADIWRQRNPYAYMYDLVKTYHPKYAKAAVKKEAAPKPKEEEEEGNEKPPEKKKKTLEDAKNLKAPATIADSGSGTKTAMSGWTAKRIDDLDEMELDQVPKEVYEKYLLGELD